MSVLIVCDNCNQEVQGAVTASSNTTFHIELDAEGERIVATYKSPKRGSRRHLCLPCIVMYIQAHMYETSEEVDDG